MTKKKTEVAAEAKRDVAAEVAKALTIEGLKAIAASLPVEERGEFEPLLGRRLNELIGLD